MENFVILNEEELKTIIGGEDFLTDDQIDDTDASYAAGGNKRKSDHIGQFNF